MNEIIKFNKFSFMVIIIFTVFVMITFLFIIMKNIRSRKLIYYNTTTVKSTIPTTTISLSRLVAPQSNLFY
jgi:hypothetical protein